MSMHNRTMIEAQAVHPVPARHVCVDIGRDIFYMEDRAEAEA